MAAADGDYAQEHYHQNDFSEGAASAKDDESGNLLGGTWKTPPSRLGRAAMLIWLGVIITCIAGLVALVFTAVTVESISAQLPRDYGDCGASRTAREAREKGCVFDAMSWIWTRPECYDEELSKGYLKRANFTFHTDPNLTAESQVSMESVIRGDHPNLFTQNIYHSLHCTVCFNQRRIKGSGVLTVLTHLRKVHVEENAQISDRKTPCR